MTKNSVVANQYGSALNISSPTVAQGYFGFGAVKARVFLKDAFNDGMMAQVSPFNVADKFFNGTERDTTVPKNQKQTRFKPERKSNSSIRTYVRKIPTHNTTKGHVSVPAYLNNVQVANVAKTANTRVFVVSDMTMHSFLYRVDMSGMCGRGVGSPAAHLFAVEHNTQKKPFGVISKGKNAEKRGKTIAYKRCAIFVIKEKYTQLVFSLVTTNPKETSL